MAEHDHPIAGGVFLLVVATAIGFLAKAGLAGGEQAEIDHRIDEAARLDEEQDFEHAEQILSGLVQRHPESEKAVFALGVIQVHREQLDEADKSFAHAFELDPTLWDAVAERAEVRKQRGDDNAALEYLEKIPSGMGHIKERLETALWASLRSDPRIVAIRERHGIRQKESTQRVPNDY